MTRSRRAASSRDVGSTPQRVKQCSRRLHRPSGRRLAPRNCTVWYVRRRARRSLRAGPVSRITAFSRKDHRDMRISRETIPSRASRSDRIPTWQQDREIQREPTPAKSLRVERARPSSNAAVGIPSRAGRNDRHPLPLTAGQRSGLVRRLVLAKAEPSAHEQRPAARVCIGHATVRDTARGQRRAVCAKIMCGKGVEACEHDSRFVTDAIDVDARSVVTPGFRPRAAGVIGIDEVHAARRSVFDLPSRRPPIKHTTRESSTTRSTPTATIPH